MNSDFLCESEMYSQYVFAPNETQIADFWRFFFNAMSKMMSCHVLAEAVMHVWEVFHIPPLHGAPTALQPTTNVRYS